MRWRCPKPAMTEEQNACLLCATTMAKHSPTSISRTSRGSESSLNRKSTLCANPIALAPTASNCPRRPRWRRVCVGAGSERSDGSDESDGSGRSGGVEPSRHGGFSIRWPCVDYAYHQRCAYRPCYAYRPSSSGPTSLARQASPPRQRIQSLFCGA